MAQPDPKDTIAASVESTEEKSTMVAAGASPRSSTGPLKPGQLVDAKYEILELTGTGGMSSVYRARQIFTKQIVALKVLSPTIAAQAGSVQRFRHEAKAVGKLNHPNIVRMFDFDVVNGLPYLTMDFVEGKSLSALIKENNGLPPSSTIPLFLQLCQALAHAHAQGVLHRDLKPSNVIICQIDGQEFVKLVDFGIAKMESDETQGLTQTGEVFGSPFYMSPEQCQGHKLDARADIYAVGCMLFECLTGQPPFQGSNVYATIRMQMEDPPPALASIKKSLRGALADELQAIVNRCLQKQPKDRFESMEELGEVLEKSQTKSPLSAFLNKISPKSQIKRRSRTSPQVALIVMVLCALAVLAAFALAFPFAINSINDWWTAIDENAHRPTGTPMQQWQTVMKRGMNHFNQTQLPEAETNLEQAAVLAKSLNQLQQTLPLKQLRILYRVQNNAAKESEINARLKILSQQRSQQTDTEKGLLLQTISFIPEHPTAQQMEQVHGVISKALAYASQCENEDNMAEARRVLLPAQERLRKILPANDPSMLDLNTHICWLQADSNAAERLSAITTLTPWQRGLLTMVKAEKDLESGSPDDGERGIKQALPLLETHGKTLPLGRAQEWAAYLATKRDAYSESEPLFSAAIDTYRALGADWRVAECTERIAHDLAIRGNPQLADAMLKEELSRLNLEKTADQQLAAECYEEQIYTDRELNKNFVTESRKAIEFAQISMDPESNEYKRLLAYTVDSFWRTNNHREVVGLSRQLSAIATLSQPPDVGLNNRARDLMSCSLTALADYAQAKEIFSARLSEFLETPDSELPDCNEWFVDACTGPAHDSGQVKQVIGKLSSSIKRLQNSTPPDSIVQEIRWLARVQAQSGDQPSALKTYEQATTFIAAHHVSGRTQYDILKDYAWYLGQAGNSAKSKEEDQAAQNALAGGQLIGK